MCWIQIDVFRYHTCHSIVSRTWFCSCITYQDRSVIVNVPWSQTRLKRGLKPCPWCEIGAKQCETHCGSKLLPWYNLTHLTLFWSPEDLGSRGGKNHRPTWPLKSAGLEVPDTSSQFGGAPEPINFGSTGRKPGGPATQLNATWWGNDLRDDDDDDAGGGGGDEERTWWELWSVWLGDERTGTLTEHNHLNLLQWDCQLTYQQLRKEFCPLAQWNSCDSHERSIDAVHGPPLTLRWPWGPLQCHIAVLS